jgi:hypothetical protein
MSHLPWCCKRTPCTPTYRCTLAGSNFTLLFCLCISYLANPYHILLILLHHACPDAARGPPAPSPACASWRAAVSPFYFACVDHILLIVILYCLFYFNMLTLMLQEYRLHPRLCAPLLLLNVFYSLLIVIFCFTYFVHFLYLLRNYFIFLLHHIAYLSYTLS